MVFEEMFLSGYRAFSVADFSKSEYRALSSRGLVLYE